jgi:hypothetical protein
MTDRTHDPGNAHAETQSRRTGSGARGREDSASRTQSARGCAARWQHQGDHLEERARERPSLQHSLRPHVAGRRRRVTGTVSLSPARNSCASRNCARARMPARMSFDRNTGWSSRGTLRRAHRNGKAIPNFPMMNARTSPRSKPSGKGIRKINRAAKGEPPQVIVRIRTIFLANENVLVMFSLQISGPVLHFVCNGAAFLFTANRKGKRP